MGMAAIGVSLWKYIMKYSPENPSFFNRDRFVLSNGIATSHLQEAWQWNLTDHRQAIPLSSNTLSYILLDTNT